MLGEDGTSAPPRVLLVGSLLPAGKGADPSYVLASGLASSPTLHDFGVIICRYSNAAFLRVSSDKWAEWYRFLQAGGLAFILGIEPSLQRHIPKVLRVDLALDRESGSEFSWKQGPAVYSVLRDRTCTKWSVAVARGSEREGTVLGRNNAGAAIAFEVRVSQGSVTLLPAFDGNERRTLIRDLVRFGEDQWRVRRLGQKLPDWAMAFPLESEKSLSIQKISIENRLVALQRTRRILVDEGSRLSKACHQILQELFAPEGFATSWKENDGAHDIELISGTLTVIVEVRASTKAVNVELARQLTHHMQQSRPTTSEVKGLMLVNAYRDTDAGARPPPLTAECVNYARENGQCAMTTTQLLIAYDRIKSGKLTSSQLLEAIKNTSGAFVFG